MSGLQHIKKDKIKFLCINFWMEMWKGIIALGVALYKLFIFPVMAFCGGYFVGMVLNNYFGVEIVCVIDKLFDFDFPREYISTLCAMVSVLSSFFKK